MRRAALSNAGFPSSGHGKMRGSRQSEQQANRADTAAACAIITPCRLRVGLPRHQSCHSETVFDANLLSEQAARDDAREHDRTPWQGPVAVPSLSTSHRETVPCYATREDGRQDARVASREQGTGPGNHEDVPPRTAPETHRCPVVPELWATAAGWARSWGMSVLQAEADGACAGLVSEAKGHGLWPLRSVVRLLWRVGADVPERRPCERACHTRKRAGRDARLQDVQVRHRRGLSGRHPHPLHELQLRTCAQRRSVPS